MTGIRTLTPSTPRPSRFPLPQPWSPGRDVAYSQTVKGAPWDALINVLCRCPSRRPVRPPLPKSDPPLSLRRSLRVVCAVGSENPRRQLSQASSPAAQEQRFGKAKGVSGTVKMSDVRDSLLQAEQEKVRLPPPSPQQHDDDRCIQWRCSCQTCTKRHRIGTHAHTTARRLPLERGTDSSPRPDPNGVKNPA